MTGDDIHMLKLAWLGRRLHKQATTFEEDYYALRDWVELIVCN